MDELNIQLQEIKLWIEDIGLSWPSEKDLYIWYFYNTNLIDSDKLMEASGAAKISPPDSSHLTEDILTQSSFYDEYM